MDAPVAEPDWKHFLKVKSIDYKGDEVKVARRFSWKNISLLYLVKLERYPLLMSVR